MKISVKNFQPFSVHILNDIGRKDNIRRDGVKCTVQTEVSEIITDFGREPLTGVGLAICRV